MPATTPSTVRRVRGAVRAVHLAEPQRVHQRNRPRAHREDVADDAADAGRRALVRLDERGMVVRFDLEDGGQAVADVDGAGVFAGPLQHARTLASAASAGECASSCSCSAPTTSPRRCRARSSVGSRSSDLTMRSYSSGVRPWRSRTSGSMRLMMRHVARRRRARRARDHRFEQHEPVGAAERRLARAFGMRHQPDDVAAGVADAGDAVHRRRSDSPRRSPARGRRSSGRSRGAGFELARRRPASA